MPCASWAASFFLLSRSKQQPIVTWGILNRITESVKIVPQWLQSYFSRNEDVCSCSTDRREAAQQLENREDEHVINADEERANIHDGRITPEPTVSNTEDTAASQNTSVPLLWSLETERHSLSWDMATSSKTPALNVSVIEAFPSELGNLRSLKQVIWEILVFILSKQV
ncbi:nuclear pore complex protein Nup153-like isoform 1-T1 [Hipposideros larvatus]